MDMAAIQAQPFGKRMAAYWRQTGPGYLQSAMTLGGGTVASCAALGSQFGYKYLWVQLVAMTFGFVVLACVAKQTTYAGERPYDVFWKRLHPSLAILWGGSALIATILWHIPQYSLTANGVVVLAESVSINADSGIARGFIGAVLLGLACGVLYMYNAGAKGLRLYEFVVKLLVWMVVVSFGIAVFAGGAVDWGRFFTGITGIDFIRDLSANGIEQAAVKPVIAALAAAVGINMIFLYPYSLLQRGWGRDHKELAYFDLVTGMALPFIIATSLMIVAVAKTIGPDEGSAAEAVRDIREIIPVLAPALGDGLASFIIGAGILAIGFSTIITHMLAVGFIGCEMSGLPHEGRTRWLFSLLPAIGVIGVAIKFPIPLAITASTLAMPLMPITVICFIVLLNQRDYMGDETPTGGKRLAWNAILITAVVFMSGAAFLALQKNWGDLQGLLN